MMLRYASVREAEQQHILARPGNECEQEEVQEVEVEMEEEEEGK